MLRGPFAPLRRLAWALFALSAALGAVLGAQALAATPPLSVTEVKPGVFVHVGAIEDWTPEHGGDVANLGFVVGTRCVAVIDTGGTPQVGRSLRAAVERVSKLPVCYVINTHAHPDHVLGNDAFADAAVPMPQFVASARFNRSFSAREPYYLNALRRDFRVELAHAAVVYPSVGVNQPLDIDLGGRVLTLRAWPTAHTDNDLTVYDPLTRTLFASDLLFVQHLPVLDGSLRGWLGVMGELARLDVATVVPGHGNVSSDWPAAMGAQAAYLNALLRDTRAALKSRWTLQQATERIAFEPRDTWRLTERFHRRNVTAAYAELEWEDEPVSAPTGAAPAASPASGARPGT
jgi:quinoprotein relay system zinc metallohydrolase 2